MSETTDDARGALLDIDGTLLRHDRAIEGAAGLLDRLARRGVPFRLLTNTTRRPRAETAATLARAGLRVPVKHVLAPAVLARRRILESGRTRAALLVADAARADFGDVEPVDRAPDWVVVGDLGAAFDWHLLNRAMGWLLDGAKLVALQKNRYWEAGPGDLRIDAGPFVAALEYAARVEAELIGKPSARFFGLALAELDLPAGEVVVVGDDVENDGRGGHAAGCRTVLVRTGKFRPGDAERATGGYPDRVVDSVADLFV